MDRPSPLATLPADVAQVDETGYVWTFLDRAAESDRILPGSVVSHQEPSRESLIVSVQAIAGVRSVMACDTPRAKKLGSTLNMD